MRRPFVGALLLGSAIVSCTWLPAPSEQRDAAPLAAIEGVATHVPRLARLLAPSSEGFARTSDPSDRDSDGRIVSAGWRSTKEKRFEDLGARLPDAANEELEVGLSRFELLRLRVRLTNARVSAATVDQGRVIYPNALEHTDRVIVSARDSLEELLVLRDAEAPREFTWTLDLPESLRIAPAQRSEDGFMVADARGRAVLHMPQPVAWDGEGREVPLDTVWSDAPRTLRLTLRGVPSSWPVSSIRRSKRVPGSTRATLPRPALVAHCAGVATRGTLLDAAFVAKHGSVATASDHSAVWLTAA